MYLYIYTVYVIVEHEMWLLHFIFEGLFVYFFQNCRKRCYIKTEYDDDGGEKRNYLKLPVRNQKKEKERAIALIAYEDISNGGGVYNN